jgi:hypothetical protein
MWEKHGIKEPLRFLGFCLSMLPVPGIQQAGAALDRHLGDKAFEAELEVLWAEISAANELVGQVATLEEAIQEIAKTIEASPNLQTKTSEFIDSLGSNQIEFSVLTENQSYQELRSSVIHADISEFVATGGSTNVIQDSTIHADTTHLHATDNSRNFVDRSTFQGSRGAVSMQGITTQGPIIVQGSGIGFGAGGSISFGSNPNLVSANCPVCNELLQADKRELFKYSQVQCYKCKTVHSFKLPKA